METSKRYQKFNIANLSHSETDNQTNSCISTNQIPRKNGKFRNKNTDFSIFWI